MAETTHTAWRREKFREQRDPFFSVFFCSIRRPLITFKLPRRDKDTPLRLCNFSDLRRLGCVTSAHLEWPVWSSSSGNVMQCTSHSLPVHHWSGTFTLSHIISWAHLRDFFRLLAIGLCHMRYFRNCRCDHHRAEITIMQFIGQSLPAHHFFYGTVRIFTLWAKLYFTQTYRLTIKTKNYVLTGLKWTGECTRFLQMGLDILYSKKWVK